MLKNKVALITGGSKGIGYAIAEKMIQEGIHVAITGRSLDTVEKAASELSASGGKVLGLQADVRSLESQQIVIEKIIEKWGRLDILVANAGIGHFNTIDNLTKEQWDETINVNLTGVFNSVKASVEHIKASKGYIFTISSLAGTNFFAGGTAYNASKFGLTGFTQALMLDLRQYDVKVSTIMPGSVSSYFGGRTPDQGKDWRIQPEDLGKIIIDLLEMHPRTLPSKIEVRPLKPPTK